MEENGGIMMTDAKVLTFKGIEEISYFIVEEWTKLSKKAIEERDRFVVAVSGGRTPVKLYQRLAGPEHALPWDKTHIFMADERFIPFSAPESNYGMIKKNLLNKAGLPKRNTHPVYIEKTAGASALKYENELRDFFGLEEGEFPKFDLIMLGIGEDGHTASLFPGSQTLLEKERLAVSVELDSLEHKRVTLTLPVINNAENIFFLARGGRKAEIIKEVLESNNCSLPASQIGAKSRKALYLLDNDAAALLGNQK